ncbi:hypothetical protein TNCV_1997001 [Trichonephila clavipes]|uniref:Uncharacterized protein n=1 Tax=Trichonephila clavipes TaxID=2585209 RepID=A0A8X6RL75_TRICX|nr:hypothetical protein TNCV_1997001 [Trichonephila clavipes]
MMELNLIQHIVNRLEPQVLDYVEVRNPSTRAQLLQVISKFEERYLTRETWGSTKNFKMKDQIGRRVGNLPTIIGIEIGGFENRTRNNMNNQGFENRNWNNMNNQGFENRNWNNMNNQGFENRNRNNRSDHRFENNGGRNQFGNRDPSESFNRGDQRQGGRLNCLKVQVDQNDQSHKLK